MSLSMKKYALLGCGCGCGQDNCNEGCCFAWELFEGRRIPSKVPYVVSAPNCAEVDGYSCEFNPYSFPGNTLQGDCGWCSDAPSDCETQGLVSIQGGVFTDNGGECIETPCTLQMQFALQCRNPVDSNSVSFSESASASTDSPCSEDLRLLIKLNWAAPGAVLQQVDMFGPDQHYILTLRPSAHECLNAENDGLLAVFDLSVISDECGETYADGACVGQSSCCRFNACSFVDAILTVG